MKQHQLIAIEKGRKDTANAAVTNAYQAIQQLPLLVGISRRYKPTDDSGEQRPPEHHLVQTRVHDELEKIRAALIPAWDIVASKDQTNTVAKANVVVDGKVILSDVSVPTLLWLEKQLVDIRTFFSKLPQLDPSRKWSYDPDSGAYRSDPEETTSSKKIPKFLVQYEATPQHPAQIREYTDDVRVGTWTTTHFSGALPAEEVHNLQTRASELLRAVQIAREEANGTTVVEKEIGAPIFDYLVQ